MHWHANARNLDLTVVALTDCRSLYDTLIKDGAPTLPQGKRLAIDLAALSDLLEEHGWNVKGMYRKVPTDSQLADHFTKVKPPEQLRKILDRIPANSSETGKTVQTGGSAVPTRLNVLGVFVLAHP
eukprot:4528886-Amphidinium_carterae.1